MPQLIITLFYLAKIIVVLKNANSMFWWSLNKKIEGHELNLYFPTKISPHSFFLNVKLRAMINTGRKTHHVCALSFRHHSWNVTYHLHYNFCLFSEFLRIFFSKLEKSYSSFQNPIFGGKGEKRFSLLSGENARESFGKKLQIWIQRYQNHKVNKLFFRSSMSFVC